MKQQEKEDPDPEVQGEQNRSRRGNETQRQRDPGSHRNHSRRTATERKGCREMQSQVKVRDAGQQKRKPGISWSENERNRVWADIEEKKTGETSSSETKQARTKEHKKEGKRRRKILGRN